MVIMQLPDSRPALHPRALAAIAALGAPRLNTQSSSSDPSMRRCGHLCNQRNVPMRNLYRRKTKD